MSSNFGGYGSAESQARALSNAMEKSIKKHPDAWDKYSNKAWVEDKRRNASLNDYELSQKLLAQKKSIDATKKLKEVEIKLSDINSKKNELKSIESMKTGNSKVNLQMKMASNTAYRSLQSQEADLQEQKKDIEKTIRLYESKMKQIDLASDAGKIFSAGINLEPVMDHDKPKSSPITSPALSPEERAETLGKENSLIDPNFSLNDVVTGMKEQGESYIGGNPTTLDKAIVSPFLDIKEAVFNPEQHQSNIDYGYTNMENSAKEISKEPDKFVGNVVAEIGVSVAPIGMVGKVGKVGKDVVKFSAKEINDVEKLVMKADMNKLNVDPKIQNKVSKEMDDFYSNVGLNPNRNVNISELPKIKNSQKNIDDMLKKVGDDLGTTIYTGYSNKNARKYTGIGIASGFAFGTSQQNKKKNNNFNFKY